MGIITKLTNNADQVKRDFENAINAALEAIGQQAESHAKQNITRSLPRNASGTSQGTLKNSITHEVRRNEDAVYIGSNLFYAKYNEFGTGVYADGGSTGSGWWVYVKGGSKSSEHHGKRYDEAKAKQIVAMLRAKGLDAHMTQGIKPIHFLRKAATEHDDEYKAIANHYLEK